MQKSLTIIVDRIESNIVICELEKNSKLVEIPINFFKTPPKEGSVYQIVDTFSCEQLTQNIANKQKMMLVYNKELTEKRRSYILKKMNLAINLDKKSKI